MSPKHAVLSIILASSIASYASAGAALASVPRLVETAFHVQVPGAVPPGTTLWVAYGPVAGKFGIIRLHRDPSGQFVASGRFPAGTRATFYYIRGHGTIPTRAGAMPGNPVRTLGHQGPLVVGRQPVPLFRAAG
jgi:hypothetical protein